MSIREWNVVRECGWPVAACRVNVKQGHVLQEETILREGYDNEYYSG